MRAFLCFFFICFVIYIFLLFPFHFSVYFHQCHHSFQAICLLLQKILILTTPDFTCFACCFLDLFNFLASFNFSFLFLFYSWFHELFFKKRESNLFKLYTTNSPGVAQAIRLISKQPPFTYIFTVWVSDSV